MLDKQVEPAEEMSICLYCGGMFPADGNAFCSEECFHDFVEEVEGY